MQRKEVDEEEVEEEKRTFYGIANALEDAI